MQRPTSIHSEEEWLAACQNVVKTAQAILAGELEIIEGARKLSSLRFSVNAEKEADFIFFVGVESETDHLPIGDVEKNWNAVSLAEKKEEIEKLEKFFEPRAFQICRNLIQKYQM